MPIGTIPSLAHEVDRLVISVHRATAENHGDRLRPLLAPLGLESPSHLIDLAEFVANDALTPDIVRLRFRYESPATLAGDLERLASLGAFETGLADPELAAAVDAVLDARWTEAARMWPGVLGVPVAGAEAALAVATGDLTDHYHRLPRPEEPAPRLHHLLTGLRYLRMDAHVVAWTSVGLNREQILALTAAWRRSPNSIVPAELTRRGWLDVDGRITAMGKSARLEIEDATNEACRAAFAVVPDIDRWRESLAELGRSATANE